MKLTYTDLVQRLVDLERLAEPPAVGEQGGCYSSYDRRSRYNSETGTYEAWDANDDGSGFIRIEGDWIVVFERAGPGVIWRSWSALPGDGTRSRSTGGGASETRSSLSVTMSRSIRGLTDTLRNTKATGGAAETCACTP